MSYQSFFTLVSVLFIFYILVLSLVVKKKLRKAIWIGALVFVLLFAAFWIVNPFIIKNKQQTAVREVEIYLNDEYPDQQWEIIDHHLIPSSMWGIEVIVSFKKEPNRLYSYRYEDHEVLLMYYTDK